MLLFEGLLSITIGTGSTAKEIMEQSIPHLERALLLGSDALKIAVCLAKFSLSL